MDLAPLDLALPTPEHLDTARDWGRLCARAGAAQRDLATCAAGYGDLFAAEPFDPGLYATLAFACAYGAPWLSTEQLRLATRTCLWCFGLDWRIDHAARSRAEVHATVRACLAVADGGTPAGEDHLGRFLADLRDELATAPTSPAIFPLWRDELGRMLHGMAREWDWRTAPPGLDAYLANADNLGFAFVYVTHWFFTGARYPDAEAAALRRVGRLVQQVIRLLNDLGTYRRDLSWGDLNALRLGVDPAEVLDRVTDLTDRSRELIAPLRAGNPGLTGYLERQIGFNLGFYGVGDYWGWQ